MFAVKEIKVFLKVLSRFTNQCSKIYLFFFFVTLVMRIQPHLVIIGVNERWRFCPKFHNSGPVHPPPPPHRSVVLSPLQKSSPKLWFKVELIPWDITCHFFLSKHRKCSLHPKVLFWSDLIQESFIMITWRWYKGKLGKFQVIKWNKITLLDVNSTLCVYRDKSDVWQPRNSELLLWKHHLGLLFTEGTWHWSVLKRWWTGPELWDIGQNLHFSFTKMTNECVAGFSWNELHFFVNLLETCRKSLTSCHCEQSHGKLIKENRCPYLCVGLFLFE